MPLLIIKNQGEEIDPKAVIKNFQNLPNKYYFGADGRKVANLPEFTTHFPIQKVGSELYLRNSSPVISLDSSGLTINDNKLYLRVANDHNGKLVRGYLQCLWTDYYLKITIFWAMQMNLVKS